MTATDAALFDAAAYETPELRMPRVDGEPIGRLAAKFTGNLKLERGDTNHVDLIRNSKVGSTKTLTVEVLVGPPVPDVAYNSEGELVDMGMTRSFQVVTIYTDEQ